MDNEHPIDPLLPMEKGQEILDKGNPDMAMVYFFFAGEKFAEREDWLMAGNCFYKAAYCYELEGRFDKAAEDYQRAAAYYQKGRLYKETQGAQQAAARMLGEGIDIYDDEERDAGNQRAILVIGVVGRNGSGKDEVVKRLRDKFGVPTISTGDITREIAAEEGIDPTRENLNRISQRCWEDFGREYFPLRIVQRINENSWNMVAVTGIRPPSDVHILRAYYGDDFVLISVLVTDPWVRYERLIKRSETRDPKGFDEFLDQEKQEEKVFQLQETLSMANATLYNDSSLEDFQKSIDMLAESLGIPELN